MNKGAKSKKSYSVGSYLIVALVFLVGVIDLYLIFDSPSVTSRAVSSTCFDSDKGTAKNVAGYVEFEGVKYYDECTDGNTLKEYTCYFSMVSWWKRSVRSLNIPCENGCQDGACVKYDCKNECKANSMVCYRKAISGAPMYSTYRSCGNYDADPCLELGGDVLKCPSDKPFCTQLGCMPIMSKCNDSDGGIDGFTKGYVQPKGTIPPQEDFCTNYTTVMEAYCTPEGSAKYVGVYCSKGCTATVGACTK